MLAGLCESVSIHFTCYRNKRDTMQKFRTSNEMSSRSPCFDFAWSLKFELSAHRNDYYLHLYQRYEGKKSMQLISNWCKKNVSFSVALFGLDRTPNAN